MFLGHILLGILLRRILFWGIEIEVPPTVSETKASFLRAYKRPIPSIYNTVLQELIVQQHLMRYKRTYQYDAVFALGFVTVYDQLMEGYPSDEDRDAIFKAYIKALKEEPDQYRFCFCLCLFLVALMFGNKGIELVEISSIN